MSTLQPNMIHRSGNQTDADLARGIAAVSIRAAAHSRPIAITLWQEASIGTRIESLMHDLTDRIEVGTLSSNLVNNSFEDEKFIDIPREFSHGFSLTKLIIQVHSHSLESGIILTSRSGHELVVVAGAYPYSLAIRGLGDATHLFEPEYPLDEYQRHKIL
jgi:hypothetical protein